MAEAKCVLLLLISKNKAATSISFLVIISFEEALWELT